MHKSAKKILVVLGTRPEAIKLAPVVMEARKHSDIHMTVCSTGQHQEMLHQVLRAFGIECDIELQVMEKNQTLPRVTAKLLNALDDVMHTVKPDWVIVQGDTATVFAASLAAFYHKIQIAHVEAGLRTGDISSPFPEEMNRKFCDLVSDLYFTPTLQNTKLLLAEGVSEEQIIETGNTVIDALLQIKQKIEHSQTMQHDILEILSSYGFDYDETKKLVLITGHRRENFGEAIRNICEALKQLATSHPDCQFLYPVHLNPHVQEPVHAMLSHLPNITLIAPVEYPVMVYLMVQSHFIITDSGGIQEEAPSLQKPLLITRDSTERPEVLTHAKAMLVGSSVETIVDEAERLLALSEDDYTKYTSDIHNPFGDGTAAQQIVHALANRPLDIRIADDYL